MFVFTSKGFQGSARILLFLSWHSWILRGVRLQNRS